MANLERYSMPRKRDKESLKKKFEKALEMIWKTPGNPLPEEPLPELPKAPLSQEQIDSTRDPLDVLADKMGNEKSEN